MLQPHLTFEGQNMSMKFSANDEYFLLQHVRSRPYRPLVHTGSMHVLGFFRIRRRGHTPALRVHPAVQVVGDVTSRDVTQGTHRHVQRSAPLQHLLQGERGQTGREKRILRKGRRDRTPGWGGHLRNNSESL